MCNILFLRLTAFRKMYGLVKTLVIKLGFESFVNSEESKTVSFVYDSKAPFESFVNSEESKTAGRVFFVKTLFESFVNSEESKTQLPSGKYRIRFESFVNSEESKTHTSVCVYKACLRALLIQKRVKLSILFVYLGIV